MAVTLVNEEGDRMHVVVELWRARKSWFERSPAERADYLESVAPAIRQLLADGVELVAIGAAEPARRQTEYDYWAIWRFPHKDQVVDFNHAIEGVGWHEHFERVNVGVEAVALEDVLPTRAP